MRKTTIFILTILSCFGIKAQNSKMESIKTKIIYDVEDHGTIIKTSLPFRIGILIDDATSKEKSSAYFEPWTGSDSGSDIEAFLQKLNIPEASRPDLSRFLANMSKIRKLELFVIKMSKADFANNLSEKAADSKLYKSMRKMESDYHKSLDILMSDYHFSKNTDDTLLLQKTETLAEEFQVPFIAATKDSRSNSDFSLVRVQAPATSDTYHNPAFSIAEQVANNFDRYAWPVVSEQAEPFSYQLIACRFAQYIKTILQNKIGSLMTRANVESFLNTWISQYVLLDDRAPLAVQAAYPLKSARIAIEDVSNEPGSYMATMFIQPQFLLGAQPTYIRLVFKLPPVQSAP
ncbi:hypothetical protein [Epilithonimonas sp. UC225_85]|uniref:hypothetical protein n=1 Tax=Epilithonimonas sp. UC225_85 TaxID=3350167 RepID=UPI0036D39E70